MKFIILLFFIIINTQLSRGDIKSEDLVLEAVDNICGDTWCEGDFNFEFTHFDLDKGKGVAKLMFNLLFEEDIVKKYPTKCILNGFNNFSDIITNYNGYYGVQLTDNYYEKLSECISDREEEFRLFLGIN